MVLITPFPHHHSWELLGKFPSKHFSTVRNECSISWIKFLSLQPTFHRYMPPPLKPQTPWTEHKPKKFFFSLIAFFHGKLLISRADFHFDFIIFWERLAQLKFIGQTKVGPFESPLSLQAAGCICWPTFLQLRNFFGLEILAIIHLSTWTDKMSAHLCCVRPRTIHQTFQRALLAFFKVPFTCKAL